MHVRRQGQLGDRHVVGLWKPGLFVMLALVALSAGVTARQQDTGTVKTRAGALPSRIWLDPGAVASLDLINGVGGRAHAPSPASIFTFLKEDSTLMSPKFDVTDEHGAEWKVKLGDESQAETAATRFLWAAGYLVEEVYYVPELTVRGLPTLRRGQNQVSSGGVVHGARLERKRTPGSKLGDWDWFDNPFLGQRELSGLRVMMALLNSWDLKQINNAVCVVNGERQYMVTDLGGTFGKTGDAISRTKGKPEDYRDSKFIAKVTPGFVDFVLDSRPQFLGVFDPANYRERTRMEQITRHIPLTDVKWLSARLSQLTEAQIRDAFRAAGFDTADIESLTHNAAPPDCRARGPVKLLIQPADGVAPLLAAIKRARTSVEIAIFRCDRQDVELALKAAAARGVRVTALIAFANRGGEKSLRKLELRFLAAGIIVARTADDLVRYHGKYIVIDRLVLYLLSFNFTRLDIDHSRGFGVVTSASACVQEAVKLFKADCTRTPYKPKVEAFVVSPTNSRQLLGAFLKGAKTQLLIYDPKISDKEMLRILQERAKAGVEIRVIGQVSGRAAFEARRLTGTRLHTRTIIRDGRHAFIGSQSLRAAELDSRREVGLMIHEARVVKTLIDTFESDWKNTTHEDGGRSQRTRRCPRLTSRWPPPPGKWPAR